MIQQNPEMRFAIFVILMSIAAVHQKVGANCPDGTSPLRAAESCYDIYDYNPRARSGYYYVKRKGNTGASRVYCDMETRRCGVKGGWMRVISLDMKNSFNCPSQLQKITVTGKRICRKKVTTGCSSVPLTVGVPYAEVCGKVIGYQYGSPDAAPWPVGTHRSMDQNYMDGVSITHGSTPREHIWSYFAGWSENHAAHPSLKCPCAATGIPLSSNSFVGNHFYCESGNTGGWEKQWYLKDPLWDGAGCPTGNSCCANSGLPYFYRILPRVTTDDIEVRVCADQAFPDEDIGVEELEIYVR